MATEERSNRTTFNRDWFEKNTDRIRQETGIEIALDYERDAMLKPERYWTGKNTLKIQSGAKKKGYKDYGEGIPKNRNPFQYTSDIFKQAAWLTGWNEAEKESNGKADR